MRKITLLVMVIFIACVAFAQQLPRNIHNLQVNGIALTGNIAEQDAGVYSNIKYLFNNIKIVTY